MNNFQDVIAYLNNLKVQGITKATFSTQGLLDALQASTSNVQQSSVTKRKDGYVDGGGFDEPSDS